MELITMNCVRNSKVIIDVNELRNNERLEGACVFKRLFNIENEGFQEEKVNTELFKIYNIQQNDWCTFLNFIRNGRIEYDMASQYIEKEEERKSYQKLFIQELDSQSNNGIFLKFGPFPAFDKYVKDSINRSVNNMINEKNNSSNNPITSTRMNESWCVTIPVKGAVHNNYWRRLKQE